MMTKLREMTFIFIWILVIAFVALMVFEWGMDFTGQQGRSNVVGKINGRKISIQEFQQAMQNAYMQEKEKTGQQPDEERMKQLRDQVWEMFVQRVLFAKELQKRDIKVTDREILLHITQNPPQEIRQNPNFQTDGQFDMQKYSQALQNPEINWLPVENYYREILPFQKLQDLVTASVVVTEQEIKSEFKQNNMKSKIKFLHIPLSAFKSDSMNISENEIEAYYNNNKEEFKVEEKRQLNYVLFSTDPSSQDSANTYELAEEVLEQAKSGEDFAQLADEYSEDPSVTNNHGDLGYFEQDRMVPEFADAAFSAQPGEIVGPVKTQFGLHIIKVHDKKVEDGTEKVRASHVLLKFTASALTLEEAQNSANNFAEIAQDENFDVAAEQFQNKVQQTPEFTERSFIPGLGNMPDAVEWTFEADKNDVSEVFRNPKGYAIFQLANIQPEGYRPLAEVKDICENRVRQQKQKNLAREFAQKVQQNLEQQQSMAKVAAEYPSQKVLFDTTSEFSMAEPVPKIGQIPEVKAAAFSIESNIISRMIETDRGIYFIKVIEKTPFKEEEYKQQRAQIRNRLIAQKKQRFFSKWYENLKENADIEDNRKQFFRS